MICTKCAAEKQPSEFHKDAKRKSGLRSDCKVCVTASSNAWAKNNPERHLERAKLWNKNNPERVKEIGFKRYYSNIPGARERARNYYALNKEKCCQASKKWKEQNSERAREKDRAWHKKNSDLVAAYSSRRRAMRAKATPKWANESAIREFFNEAARKRLATGISWHVDHIVPLKSHLVCGLHVEHNLQVIPGSENDSKGNRFWPDMPKEVIA